jgi:CheY-like chemotaxis protein
MAQILLMDDDEMMLTMLSQVLHNLGHSVRATADGPRALELYRTEKFQLVLLDLGLPSMGGIDLLREIMRIDKLARVVIMSGYLCDRYIEEALSLGAIAELVKGFHSHVLEKTRNSALAPPLES